MRIDIYESDNTTDTGRMEFHRYTEEAPDDLDYAAALAWFQARDRNSHQGMPYTVIVMTREDGA